MLLDATLDSIERCIMKKIHSQAMKMVMLPSTVRNDANFVAQQGHHSSR